MKQVSNAIGGVVVALVVSASSASAQQVMWKDNPISGKVVGLTYGRSSWTEAEALAVSYGGHLVTIRSTEERNWLAPQFAADWTSTSSFGGGYGPWIGLRKTSAGEQTTWSWASGETPSGYQLEWLPGEPNDVGGNEDFVNLHPPTWLFNDFADFQQMRALVEVAQRPARSWNWTKTIDSLPSHAVAAGDIDGDGRVDLVTADYPSSSIRYYRNSGTAGLQLVQTITAVASIVSLLDLGGDGDLDIAFTTGIHAAEGQVRFATYQGGQFQIAAIVLGLHSPTDLSTADMNADGRDDLVATADDPSDYVRIWLQDAAGNLVAHQTIGSGGDRTYGLETLDFNGDAFPDIAVRCMWSGTLHLFVGQGGGSVSAHSTRSVGQDINDFTDLAIADWDGDGVDDVACALRSGNMVRVFASRPTGLDLWRTIPSPAPLAVVAGDWDSDGFSDVLALSGTSGSRPDYGGVSGFSTGPILSGAAGDALATNINGDGLLDIVVAHSGGISVWSENLHDCNANGMDDRVEVATGVVADCNGNLLPDSCELLAGANDCNGDSILDACQLTALTDCNSNARLDTCDIASGAPDCNGNQILDVCEPLTAANDCNANGLLDYCELVAGTVPDCDLNGRPDSCDLAAGLPDCNLNQVPDTCDIGAGTSNDGDFNNIPDECSLDCNANGLLDTAECAQGLTADCNGNLVPDSCDLVAGVPDCNTNGVPDSCDVAGGQDCNANGQPDACDLAAGASDCNGNQQLDSCELAAGFGDCNANQQFDACELLAGAPDCNGNGALDACDIAAGAADCDGNQVPDACQPLDATSDCNANLILDVCDILAGALDCNLNGRPDTCDADTNGDQIPDDCQDGGTPYCFGDGAANSTPCPCGGVGAPRSGCPNSANPAGGYLVATGLPSRIADTLVLRASQMPPVATMLYFQGTSQASTASGTIGTVFGDGLRCAAGGVVRLGFRTNSAGASEIPSGGSPALHIAGLIPATGAVTRYYQGWYRDVNPSFCTANRYNLTNGVAVVWVP